MIKFKRIWIILTMLWLSQLVFLGFWKSMLIINNTWIYNSKIVPLKWWCQKVINNCDMPIWISLETSAETKSFFLNPPSCVTLTTCQRDVACAWTLPANTEWNTSSTFVQSFDWVRWLPASKAANYNASPSSNDCRYTCKLNYSWNWSSCIPDTRLFVCNPKPSVWTLRNTVSGYMQTWDWSNWMPLDTTTTYSATASTTSCRYTSAPWYRWDPSTSSIVNTCVVPASLWWWTITHWQSVTAYSASSVACWSSCVSEQRVCNWETWLLWGTYTNWTCSVQNCTPTANNVSANWYENSTISVTASASDSDWSITSYTWYSNSSCTSAIWSSSMTYTAPAQPEPTTITYYYRAQDNNWAWSNCASATVVSNNVCPNTPALVSPPNWSRTTNRQFCATVSDPGWWSVTAYFIIWWNTYAWNTVSSNGNSCYTYPSDLNWVSWYAYTRDANWSNSCSMSSSRVAYIDNVAPVTTDNANSNWRNTDMGVILSPNESSTTRYCVDTNWTCTPSIVWTNVNVTCTAGTVCASQYVRYYSTDAAGNSESIKTSAQIRIDKQPPTCSFSDNISAGPVATETIWLSIWWASTIWWRYNVNATCPTSGYPYTTTSWTENTQTNNWQYVCMYWLDAAWNYCTLASSYPINVGCPSWYVFSNWSCVPVVNWVCNNSTPLWCSAGSYINDNWISYCGGTRTWNCQWSNWWTTSPQCSYYNGACPPSCHHPSSAPYIVYCGTTSCANSTVVPFWSDIGTVATQYYTNNTCQYYGGINGARLGSPSVCLNCSLYTTQSTCQSVWMWWYYCSRY